MISSASEWSDGDEGGCALSWEGVGWMWERARRKGSTRWWGAGQPLRGLLPLHPVCVWVKWLPELPLEQLPAITSIQPLRCMEARQRRRSILDRVSLPCCPTFFGAGTCGGWLHYQHTDLARGMFIMMHFMAAEKYVRDGARRRGSAGPGAKKSVKGRRSWNRVRVAGTRTSLACDTRVARPRTTLETNRQANSHTPPASSFLHSSLPIIVVIHTP